VRHEGTNFILGIKEQETRLTLQEHDDDDDDDDWLVAAKISTIRFSVLSLENLMEVKPSPE